jgi:hypothetical protein
MAAYPSLALPWARGLASILPPSKVVVQEPCRWDLFSREAPLPIEHVVAVGRRGRHYRTSHRRASPATASCLPVGGLPWTGIELDQGRE